MSDFKSYTQLDTSGNYFLSIIRELDELMKLDDEEQGKYKQESRTTSPA